MDQSPELQTQPHEDKPERECDVVVTGQKKHFQNEKVGNEKSYCICNNSCCPEMSQPYILYWMTHTVEIPQQNPARSAKAYLRVAL
jgi:hypothetical protein